MDRILLNGLTFFGKHGCHAAENELGQKFVVDIELECDLSAAGATDALEDTIDYVNIYKQVIGEHKARQDPATLMGMKTHSQIIT